MLLARVLADRRIGERLPGLSTSAAVCTAELFGGGAVALRGPDDAGEHRGGIAM